MQKCPDFLSFDNRAALVIDISSSINRISQLGLEDRSPTKFALLYIEVSL